MALTYFQSTIQPLQLLQTQWKSQIDPVLSNTIVNGHQLTGVPLVSGNNTINTHLGQKYQGYFITGMRGAFAQVFEVVTGNTALTLTLNSSGTTTVDIWVY